jgi:benzodiazapine receptor
MAKRLIIFLIINILALYIGSTFTGQGIFTEWYTALNKAPWTPPGWVFAAAWGTIMVCLSVFMAYAWTTDGNKFLVVSLYTTQWILNVVWNPVFFKYHAIGGGLLIVSSLTIVIGYYIYHYVPVLKGKAFWLLPYFIWMLIATSLNAYIWINN